MSDDRKNFMQRFADSTSSSFARLSDEEKAQRDMERERKRRALMKLSSGPEAEVQPVMQQGRIGPSDMIKTGKSAQMAPESLGGSYNDVLALENAEVLKALEEQMLMEQPTPEQFANERDSMAYDQAVQKFEDAQRAKMDPAFKERLMRQIREDKGISRKFLGSTK